MMKGSDIYSPEVRLGKLYPVLQCDNCFIGHILSLLLKSFHIRSQLKFS